MNMAVCSTLPVLSLVGLALACVAPGTAAQQSFLIDAGPCLNLATAVERLVCFEQQVREAQELQGVAPAVVAAPAPMQPAAPQATPQPPAAQSVAPQQIAPPQPAAPTGAAAFGLREEPDAAAEPEELLGTVAEIRKFAPNQVSITLTNGQVWRQKQADRYALKEGHEVRIYTSRWGNDFRLNVKELGGFIQVERVQ